METLGFFADLFGVAGAVFSFLIWLLLKKKEKFNEQRITIRLITPDKRVELPYEIERKHLTRPELQGLLSISLPRKIATDPYKLSYLNTIDFFLNLKAAQDQKDVTVMEILCKPEEVAQFNWNEIGQQCRVTQL